MFWLYRFYQILLLWSYSNGLISKISFGVNPFLFLTLFFLIILFESIHFYFAHRLLHFKFLYKFPGTLYRTDFCVSIACHIMSNSENSDWHDFKDVMYFSDQKDEIYEFNEGTYSILANNQKENWKDIPVAWKDVDIHMMNKRAVDRQSKKIIDYYEKRLGI